MSAAAGLVRSLLALGFGVAFHSLQNHNKQTIKRRSKPVPVRIWILPKKPEVRPIQMASKRPGDEESNGHHADGDQPEAKKTKSVSFCIV